MSEAPFIPLAEPWLPEDCALAVADQVRTTFVGPGPASQTFGAKLADACGVAFAIPVASGTVALSMACLALGLRPGDEVLIPAYGVISVINAIASIGMSPRLVDIDPSTGNLDPIALDASIGPQTRAVVFIDFCAGIGPELDAVAEVCRRRGVFLIEDAAWALGRGSGARRGGSFGDIAVTSFSVPKIITTGQGGAVLCKDEAQRDAVIRISDQGDTNWRQTNVSRGIGTNLRLSDLSCALGMAQLDRLEERWARKRMAFGILKQALGAALFTASDGDASTQNVLFLEQPQTAIPILRAQGLASAQQYKVFTDHPPYAVLQGQYPGAQLWARHALYLPFGLALDEALSERVAKAAAALDGAISVPAPRA